MTIEFIGIIIACLLSALLLCFILLLIRLWHTVPVLALITRNQVQEGKNLGANLKEIRESIKKINSLIASITLNR